MKNKSFAANKSFKFFLSLFITIFALGTTSCSIIKDVINKKPSNFLIGATEIGYKSNLTADELIAMAKKEGYSESQVRERIKGTTWAKSDLVEAAILKYYRGVRNLPANFKAGATAAGYKTDITADELIALAKTEGYSQAQVLLELKDTPWEKSKLIADAITKYYENNESASKIAETLKSSINTESISNTVSAIGGALSKLSENIIDATKVSNDSTDIYTNENDDKLYQKESLTVNTKKTDSEIIYTFTYVDRTKRIITETQRFTITQKKAVLVDSDYKYHKYKITTKEDASTFVDLDYQIMERYSAALKRHGFSSQNPIYL